MDDLVDDEEPESVLDKVEFGANVSVGRDVVRHVDASQQGTNIGSVSGFAQAMGGEAGREANPKKSPATVNAVDAVDVVDVAMAAAAAAPWPSSDVDS